MHLEDFDVDDLITCSRAFASLGDGVTSMEQIAARLTTYLQTTLELHDGRPACALVRLYKTHRLGDLPDDDRGFAERSAGEPLDPTTSCLTLLGTAGAERPWNDRRQSKRHQAIPLTNVDSVERSPMIIQLIRQFGLDVADVVRPARAMKIERHHEQFNVFYVPEAAGSPSVPAQHDFVMPYGIRSVVGCGGLLPDGELFAVIFFMVVPVSEHTADLFRSLALSVKSALVPFTFKVFAATDEPGAAAMTGVPR